MTAKMHFPSSTSSSSSLITLFFLLLVIISMFLLGVLADMPTKRASAGYPKRKPSPLIMPRPSHSPHAPWRCSMSTATALIRQHVGCSRCHQAKNLASLVIVIYM
ncbi:hypothetical protein EUGRSUZ_H00400 [Eucalyptus grandis]|uniref:Uncharacterized protein n=2 Tax=Eucalyptus grandis TaxID=71139 RepID=A0ACC3JMV1_EUCGR|nr:hypothetical protein EUGRSUZ_H00400 [Eucalyptus grandis]